MTPIGMQRPLAVMMQSAAQTISPDATVCDAARQMRAEKIGALLVREGACYLGIISEADLVRKVLADSLGPAHTPVRSVMSAPLITIDVTASAHDASDLMAQAGIRHLVVVEGGEVAGILSVRDLLRYFKNWGHQ
ncbi:MAG: Putative signal-transduction protein containing cAMP-binding and CBS domain [Nitrospira sp.]|nr:MAG: Putative signal-transduction protein containing cAMP-binding and CBS domain [Nitrospira sp.]